MEARARLAAGTIDIQLGKLLDLTRFCATSPDLIFRVDLQGVSENCGRYATGIGAWVEVILLGETRLPILNTRPDAAQKLLPYDVSRKPEALSTIEAKSRDIGGPVLSNVYKDMTFSSLIVTGGQVLRLADGRDAIVYVNLPARELSGQLADIAKAGDPLIGLVDQDRTIVARNQRVERPMFNKVPDRFRSQMEAGLPGAILDFGTKAVQGTWDAGYHPLATAPGWMVVAVRLSPGFLGSLHVFSSASAVALAGIVISATLIWLFSFSDRMKARTRAAEQARLAADQGNCDKSRLLASFAHDIRTPLISLIGSLETLEIESGHKRGIETARGSAETLLQMVDDILELSFLGSGEFRLHPSPVDVRRLAQDIVDQVRGVAHEKGLTLHLEVDPVALPLVDVDRLRLQQVLANLVTNAVKYTKQGSIVLRVEARAIQTGLSSLAFSVSDTGIGLAADDIPRILREFGRLDRDAERQAQGAGLGLAIVQRILRAMKSQLTIESVPGQGSVFGFTLVLPVVAAPQAEENAAPLEGLVVLYAEDEPVIRMVTSRRLSAAGAKVIEVEDGREALDQLSAFHPDLLLLDLHMPQLSGLEVLRSLPKPLPFPVFVLTAHISGPDADAAVEAGAVDVFTKPIQIQALAAAYRAWRAHQAPPVIETGDQPTPEPGRNLEKDTFLSVFTLSDAIFSAKVLETFRTDMRADISALVLAVKAGDALEARVLAHRCLGICQVLGAVRLGTMLRCIEDAAGPGDLSSVAPLAEVCVEVLAATIAEMDALAQTKAA